MEMLRELGYCNGIENYSRIFDGRPPGSPPFTLLDFFPGDFLVFIDESHDTVPQIGGMYEGDAAARSTLVEHGFRLPSRSTTGRCASTSMRTGAAGRVRVGDAGAVRAGELGGEVVEQIIRPTGLVDPELDVRPTRGPGRRPGRRDPSGREAAASACWSRR